MLFNDTMVTTLEEQCEQAVNMNIHTHTHRYRHTRYRQTHTHTGKHTQIHTVYIQTHTQDIWIVNDSENAVRWPILYKRLVGNVDDGI